jgi:hypothetical protein
VHDIEADLGLPTTLALDSDADADDKTIWEQLKEDPNSFSRLVKILQVGWGWGRAGSFIGAEQ